MHLVTQEITRLSSIITWITLDFSPCLSGTSHPAVGSLAPTGGHPHTGKVHFQQTRAVISPPECTASVQFLLLLKSYRRHFFSFFFSSLTSMSWGLLFFNSLSGILHPGPVSDRIKTFNSWWIRVCVEVYVFPVAKADSFLIVISPSEPSPVYDQFSSPFCKHHVDIHKDE